MKFGITYDDSELRKAVGDLIQKEGEIPFTFKSEKSDNVLTGTGKRLWFGNTQSGKWYLPAQWRLKSSTWNDFKRTQVEYAKNRGANFKAAMFGQKEALQKKLDAIVRKFNQT